MNIEGLKDSVIFWLTSISSIFTIVTFFFKFPALMVWFLIGLWIATFIVVFFQARKYRKQSINQERKIEDLYKITQYIHDAIHLYRNKLSHGNSLDFFINPKTTKKDIDDYFNELEKGILNKLSEIFRCLTERNCITNFMLLDDEKGEFLCTWLYSENATVERTRRSSRLQNNQGLAGRAFVTGDVLINNNYSDTNGLFSKVREDYANFYNAGMSAPINVDKNRYGVLNVDCKETDVFKEEMRYLLAIYSDLFSAIFQMYNLAIALNTSA